MARVLPTKAGVVLKQVKSVMVRFCPFESNVESTRNFLECLHAKKAYASNNNCDLKTEVKHDGSEPVIDVLFADGDKLIMKGANLTVGEMLKVFKTMCEAKELKAEEKTQTKSA